MAPKRILGLVALLAAVLTFSLAGLPAVSADSLSQSTLNISVVDYSFQPQNLTIMAGTTVVWTNNGNAPHTATSDTGLWGSGTLSRGQSYSRVFDTAGVFPYHCAFHRSLGMTGTITVVAVAAQVYLPYLAKDASGW